MSELLTELRNLGLSMGGSFPATSFTDPDTKEDHVAQLHIGYTTDQAKADKARDLGATVTSCRASDPAYSGWEVSVRVVDP